MLWGECSSPLSRSLCWSGMGVTGAPRRSAVRPRAELVEGVVLEKRLGSLPVISDFCRRIDIAGIIDELCPIRDVALATHGQVIEVLIANRLTQPSAIAGAADWARAWAVPEVYGIAASPLGDDRLGRALDAVAEHTDTVVGTVGAAAIHRVGIDVTPLHWDMTSISLFGAYEGNDPDYPQPGWGHPKDRRPDLKQIQAGIAVSADGRSRCSTRSTTAARVRSRRSSTPCTPCRTSPPRPDS